MKTSIDYRKKVAIETTPQNEKEALSLAEECWALGCDERAEQLLQQVNDKSLAGDVLFLRAMMLSAQGGSVTEVQNLLTQAEAQGNPVAKLYNCLKAKDVKTDQLSAMAKDMPDWYLAQYCSLFTPVEEYLGPAPTAQEADEMLQQAERDAAAAIKARKDEAEAAQKAKRKAAAKQKAKEEADRRKLLALRSADAQQIQNLKIYLILLAGLFAIVELFLVSLTNVSFIAAVALSCYCSYRAIRSLVLKIPRDGIATPVRRFSLKFHIYVSVAVVTLCSHILAYVFDKMLLFASLYVLAIWITKKYIAAGMDKKAAQYREENFRKYKMMAELGGEKEQAKLAILYDDGYCVPKNRDEAVKWYRKAAEQGYEYAIDALDRLGK